MAEARAFPPDSPAPWAELVPDGEPMTVDDLLRLPDDGWHYELVEGRLVRMPPSGYRASHLAARLLIQLGAYIEAHKLGAVTTADGAYDLSAPGTAPTKGTGLAPDVAFIRTDRLPPHVTFDEDKAVPFAPDLAVEIASPNQYRPAMAKKAQWYLDAGTRLVWIVWPKRREIDIWRSGKMQPARTLRAGDTLDGEEVVPGFTYPVDDLFA